MHEIWRFSRLKERIDALGEFGRDPFGGMTRPFGSAAEREARRWFLQEASKTGLEISTDMAGNIWALYPGDRPEILAIGSHLDTVPHGGAYDGSLGVILGLESVQTLQEQEYRPLHTLGVLVLAGEEPNPFRLSTLGSRLLTGVLSFEEIEAVKDDQGLLLTEALALADAPSGSHHELDVARLRGFIEPHIEQGARLKEQGLPLAVVTTITGIVRHSITIIGEQNHAGTTAPEQRRDAVQAFAGTMELFQRMGQEFSGEVRGTVGYVSVFPNAVNIVPSRVEFIVEWRSPQDSLLHSVAEMFWTQVQTRVHEMGLELTRKVILSQNPVVMDPRMQELLHQAVGTYIPQHPGLVSWAGHDAAHLAQKVPTGMLFIRSNGKSHCPDEDCDSDDMALALRVLITALRRWDQKENPGASLRK